MATTYKSTIEVNVWKEHACIGCGSRFRYLFKRKKTGQGGTPEAASAAARKAVINALENEVDMHPCPGCGLYQPDMVGSRRSTRHWWVIAASWAALLLMMILMLADVMPASMAALAAAVACAMLGLVHLLIDFNNPNRNLESNHQLAQQKVERGDLWVPPGSKAEPAAETPVFGWSTAHAVAYVLFGLGLLALVSPELLRILHGWPVNEPWYPQVAGPGDDPYIYFPNKITSVKGYWQGNVRTEVLNAAEVGLGAGQIGSSSQHDNWGDTIHIGSKESKTSTKTLWARVSLPPNPQLEGKTLKIKMTLNVLYPKLMGNNWEQANEGPFVQTAEIRLGGAKAGSRYRAWWWGGFLGGVLLITVSSILFVRLSTGLCKLAQPTSIFAPGQDGDEERQEEAAPEVLPADQPQRDDDGGIVRHD
jgi:hypothetical protein